VGFDNESEKVVMHIMRPAFSIDGLNAFINLLPPDICMVELGSYSGESTKLFLRKAKILHCVDLWVPYEDYGNPIGYMEEAEAAFDELQRQNPDKIIKHKIDSIEASKLFENHSFDAVYIDCDHSYPAVRADILAWRPKVKLGGILAGHDYGMCHIGVKLAVDELIGPPDCCFSDSSWMKVVA